jgi:4,5-dihydroxyphthalate decarboxylase
MANVQLTLACGDYDRTRPLWDGSIRPEGLELNVILLPVEEIFLRMARHQEFEASELSMSTFLITQAKGTPRFVAIPAFPSRKFRHGDIYIRKDSRVRRVEDLRGGRIGMPEYQMTAAVWVRGILQEYYGVGVTEVEWFTAHEERLPILLPPSIRVKIIPAGTNLFDLLRKGELEAIFTARVPPPFIREEDWIVRLFPNFKEVEVQYFRKTGIFPIMHTVVLRADIYEKYPWAAQSIYKAFSQAKNYSLERLVNLGAPPVTLPWFFYEMDQTIAVMGRDFWPYGFKANRTALTKLTQYMREQGLIPEGFPKEIDRLFAPNTLETM